MALTLHAVIVSWHRAELTRRTIESFLATVTLPHSLLVVDNGSSDAQIRMIARRAAVLTLGENRYPGYATNRGWEARPYRPGPGDVDLLMRSDNDTLWLPGWCDEAAEAFADPLVGLYGPTALGDEKWTSIPSWPVGGNAIIRRELFDRGLRYSEEPWSPGIAECGRFTADALALGYTRRFSTRPAIQYLDDGDEEYRRATHAARGLPYSTW